MPPGIARANSARSSESSRPASPQKQGIPSRAPRLVPPASLNRSISSNQQPSASRLGHHPPSAMRGSAAAQQQLAQLPSRRMSLAGQTPTSPIDADLEYVSPSVQVPPPSLVPPFHHPQHERPLTPDEPLLVESPPPPQVRVLVQFNVLVLTPTIRLASRPTTVMSYGSRFAFWRQNAQMMRGVFESLKAV